MRAPSQGTTGLVLPGKVQPHHLDRLAIVYVRQSTLQQLEQHRESTALQYGLAERALRLGRPRPRVSVIDDDLGGSGASAKGRPGFQRLVAEVGLGHVGLVLGFEVSRLARSCRDWYQLLEICALAGTLIADSDGVYDPALYNDRLLLGLKGTMSEAELHIMRARLEQGRWHKAERGELGFNLSRGYLERASGEVALDPDERVRDTVRLVFDVFERRGSVHGVLRYLIDHGVALPDRGRSGPARGEIVWRRPHRGAILNMLTSPTYAGAYVFGRRRAGAPSVGARCRRAGQPSRHPKDWRVLLPDRWPAYISWSSYKENQERLSANRSKHKGVPRGGPLAAGGDPVLRPLRPSHDYLLPQQRAEPALRMHARSDQPRRATLSVPQRGHARRARHRPPPRGAAPLGDRGRPVAGRGRRAGAGSAAPAVGVAPGAGALRG
jgi:DNA invertase Pin-like site-specific DNA recombinase